MAVALAPPDRICTDSALHGGERGVPRRLLLSWLVRVCGGMSEVEAAAAGADDGPLLDSALLRWALQLGIVSDAESRRSLWAEERDSTGDNLRTAKLCMQAAALHCMAPEERSAAVARAAEQLSAVASQAGTVFTEDFNLLPADIYRAVDGMPPAAVGWMDSELRDAESAAAGLSADCERLRREEEEVEDEDGKSAAKEEEEEEAGEAGVDKLCASLDGFADSLRNFNRTYASELAQWVERPHDARQSAAVYGLGRHASTVLSHWHPVRQALSDLAESRQQLAALRRHASSHTLAAPAAASLASLSALHDGAAVLSAAVARRKAERDDARLAAELAEALEM